MEEKVDILLSVYNPNEKYLREQLISLNNQTYQNIKLYIFDDCITNRCDKGIFEECITNFEWELLPYENKNLNYIKAFETLVRKSSGEYIAFCDQDDIWNNDKIEKCVQYMKQKNVLLVASDRMIINQNDTVICESVREHSNKNYDNWNTYDDITKYNIFVTYAVGMSIVMNGKFARSILPFSSYSGHDKWVLACASTEGKVGFIDEPLVKYRRHDHNVSGVLIGIHSKKDYIKERIEPDLLFINDFKKKYPHHKDIVEIEKFALARAHGNIKNLYKYRYLAPDIALFDIVISLIPNIFFPFFVKLAQLVSSK